MDRSRRCSACIRCRRAFSDLNLLGRWFLCSLPQTRILTCRKTFLVSRSVRIFRLRVSSQQPGLGWTGGDWLEFVLPESSRGGLPDCCWGISIKMNILVCSSEYCPPRLCILRYPWMSPESFYLRQRRRELRRRGLWSRRSGETGPWNSWEGARHPWIWALTERGRRLLWAEVRWTTSGLR